MTRVSYFFQRQLHSIRTRIFLAIVLIILLVTAGVGVASYNFSSHSVQSKIQEANVEIIRQINLNLESSFEQIHNIMLIPYNYSDYITDVNLYAEMSDLDKAKFQTKMSEYFLTSLYIRQRTDLENFLLYTKDGDLLFTSSGTKERIDGDFRDLDWVAGAVAKDGDIYFSNAYMKEVRGREKLLFSTAIMIKDITVSSKFSIVKAEFNFDAISKICTTDTIGQGSETILIDQNGTVIYSTAGREAGSQFDQNLFGKINGRGGTFWADTSAGSFLVTFAESDVSGWSIISMIPRANIYDASMEIGRVTILASLLGLVMAGFLAFIFTARISKPLLKMDRLVDSVRAGDLSVRMDSSGKDEISRINQTFNQLIEEVSRLIETKYIFQIKEREYELNMLYAQINPHFLYNTLDTIRAMADTRGEDNIAETITLLADMLRYSVKNISEPVTVRQELDYVMDYLAICGIRFGSKIDFSIEVGETLMNKQISRLILQPLIENSIRHGRLAGGERLFILIAGELNAGSLIFTVKDDGVGMDEAALAAVRRSLTTGKVDDIGKSGDSSIGLVNINSRLKILYGDRGYLTINSEPQGGTTVRLILPDEKEGSPRV